MIANCAALGGVTAISGYTTSSKVSASVGGLVGQGTGMFHNCYAAGNVALTMAITPDEPAVGSLIGQMSTSRSYNGIVTDCYFNSKASVTVNGTARCCGRFRRSRQRRHEQRRRCRTPPAPPLSTP